MRIFGPVAPPHPSRSNGQACRRRTARWSETKRVHQRQPTESKPGSWLEFSSSIDEDDGHFMEAMRAFQETEPEDVGVAEPPSPRRQVSTTITEASELVGMEGAAACDYVERRERTPRAEPRDSPEEPMRLRKSVFAAHEGTLARALEGRLAGPGGEGWARRIRDQLSSMVASDDFVRARDILDCFRSVGLEEISARDVADLCMGLGMDSRGHVDGRELRRILDDVVSETRSGPTLRLQRQDPRKIRGDGDYPLAFETSPFPRGQHDVFVVESEEPADSSGGTRLAAFSPYASAPAQDHQSGPHVPPHIARVVEEETRHPCRVRRHHDQLSPVPPQPCVPPPLHDFSSAVEERRACRRQRNHRREYSQDILPRASFGHCGEVPRRCWRHVHKDRRCDECGFDPCRCCCDERRRCDDARQFEKIALMTVEEAESIVKEVRCESENHGLPSGAAYLGTVLEKVPTRFKSKVIDLIEADKKRGARALADEIRVSGKDVFGDGSRKSFREACRRLPRRWTTKTVDGLFDLIDVDGDGVLSKREQLVFTRNHSRWISQAFPPSSQEEFTRLVRFEPLVRAALLQDDDEFDCAPRRRKLLSVVRDVASRVRKKLRVSVDRLRSALSAIERRQGSAVQWSDFLDFLESRRVPLTLTRYEENTVRRLLVEKEGRGFDWRSFLDLVESSSRQFHRARRHS